jgi:hypothetical protein
VNAVAPPPPKMPWTSWPWPGNMTRQLVVVPHVVWEALFRLSEVPREAQLPWGHTAGRVVLRRVCTTIQRERKKRERDSCYG